MHRHSIIVKMACFLFATGTSSLASAQQYEPPSGPNDGKCMMYYQEVSIFNDPDCSQVHLELIPEKASAFEPTYLRVRGIALDSILVDTATPALAREFSGGARQFLLQAGIIGEDHDDGDPTIMQVDVLAPLHELVLDPDAYFDVYLGSRSDSTLQHAMNVGVILHVYAAGHSPWDHGAAFPIFPFGTEHFFGPLVWSMGWPGVPFGYPLDYDSVAVSPPTGWMDFSVTLHGHRAIVDYSGVWSGPAESGSGLAVQHVLSENLLAGHWFGYGAEGEPVFLVLAPCAWTSATRCEADLVRASGTPYGEPSDPADLAEETVGRAVLEFSDPANGVLDITVDEVLTTMPIRRFLPRPPEGYPAPPQ